VLDWLGQGLVALTLLFCALLVFVVLGLLYLLLLHLALRRQGLAQERRRLALPLPPDDALPHVVVQIPVFNEGALVERAIAGVSRLDWPRDRLHVQVCDDSTDGTTERARAAAERAAAAGIDIEVIHRPVRNGFKAGALNEALARTDHGYFAILDVDYLPPADFLRRCMTVLLADETLAFVQARIDFLNADENVLTRAQTILLDYHLGFEQATRSWADQLLPFNGTCGVWRRAAIEAAGGWDGRILLEDWDLSLRARLAGWRGTFLTSVTAAGELPTGWRAWMLQQRRWATGIGQVVWKSLPAIRAKRNLTPRDYWDTLLPFGTWLAYTMFSGTLILTVAAMLARPADALWLGLTVYGVFLGAAIVLFASMRVADRTVRRDTPLVRFYLEFQIVLLLCLYICWASLRSVPATVLGRPRIFMRTPKRGSAAHPP